MSFENAAVGREEVYSLAEWEPVGVYAIDISVQGISRQSWQPLPGGFLSRFEKSPKPTIGINGP